MSVITKDAIITNLATFREKHGLKADDAYDALIVSSLFQLTNPPDDNTKNQITGILKDYFHRAPNHEQKDGEPNDHDYKRFFHRIFKRLLLKNGQFKSSESTELLASLGDYNLHFLMKDELARTPPESSPTSEPSIPSFFNGPVPSSSSDVDLSDDDQGAATQQESPDDETVELLPSENQNKEPAKELPTLHMRETITEIETALAEEIYYNDPKHDGFYIGYRHKEAPIASSYQPFVSGKATRDAITEDKAISPTPPIPGINPFNVASSINGGVDNALSTGGDRVLKFFMALAAQAGGVLEHGKEIHGAFSWIGLAVSFIYTTTFAFSYLYRRFYMKEEVVFGVRDGIRMALSLGFLGLSLAATFAAGPVALFVLGFPIIAGISVLFSLGEHIYDCLFKNKEELEQLPAKKQAIGCEIEQSKKHLQSHEAKLAEELGKTNPDIRTVKELRKQISVTHTTYKRQHRELVKLLEQERSLTESQIRLKDPLTIFLTISRTVVTVINITGAIVFFINPIAGLSLLALAGVLMLVNWGITVYNKERLDRKIEGRNGKGPAVGELSHDLVVPKPMNTHELVNTTLLDMDTDEPDNSQPQSLSPTSASTSSDSKMFGPKTTTAAITQPGSALDLLALGQPDTQAGSTLNLSK